MVDLSAEPTYLEAATSVDITNSPRLIQEDVSAASITETQEELEDASTAPTQTVHLRAKDSSDEIITKLKNKLTEASRVYSKDKETISWFVMQSVHDPRDFTIVERYEQESSQQYHLNNPYWKTFDPYVMPLLEGKMDLRRFEELDTSKDVVVE
ncbi:hypothetical protein FRB93_005861 [Tulasnella sp. JGI-2019a]|nr:hypothetical protein FRB93_005861 [Tulasnella sp. JGI-2019a]